MNSSVLDKLVKNGSIKSYNFKNISCDGEPNTTSEFRNTERLEITFLNGESLTIDTGCSGCLENASMFFS